LVVGEDVELMAMLVNIVHVGFVVMIWGMLNVMMWIYLLGCGPCCQY
jgi:hypothetical protein